MYISGYLTAELVYLLLLGKSPSACELRQYHQHGNHKTTVKNQSSKLIPLSHVVPANVEIKR